MHSSATFFLFGLLSVIRASSEMLPAQVSVSVTALTPIQLSASDGVTSNQSVQPIGPIPAGYFSFDSQVATSAITWFQCDSEANSTSAYCALGVACDLASPTASGASNTFELLVTFQAPTPTPVRFRVEFANPIPAGATAPQALVDVGNDGSIDFANGFQLGFFGPQVIGPQPLQFRVVLDASLQQLGFLGNDVLIRVEPDNALQIDTAAIGCATENVQVAPSFLNRGIRVRNAILTSLPRVSVFGLQTQPLLLPTITTLPCLLLPRPDVVMVMPTFSSIELAMPAAVRPVTLWIQTVTLQGSDLYTGYATQVTTL